MRVVRPASRDQRSARDTTYDPRTGSPPPERTAHSVRTVDRRLSSRSFRSRQSRWVHDRRIGPEETVAYANEPDSEPDPTTWNRRRRTNGAWWNPKQVPENGRYRRSAIEIRRSGVQSRGAPVVPHTAAVSRFPSKPAARFVRRPPRGRTVSDRIRRIPRTAGCSPTFGYAASGFRSNRFVVHTRSTIPV